ncbi:flagellar basal body-associated FliL family protein [Reinekea sp.]|jgi:flagellar FliL protein|uniref:flagellar basal body-associated FliL family protein n=1 Tax=Reinekea sp. TaxID=1970455 RepID=UPI002A817629|nr:flagellar basal body-associated FliL family protein [Reinekea sp.]
MADEDAPENEEAPKGGGKLKLIAMIVVGVLLIAGLSIGATWFMLKDKMSDPESMGPDGADASEMMEDEEIKGPAIYHAVQPAFIINYTNNGRSRFLQVELSLLTRNPGAIEVLVLHNPLIRNNLLDVFARQDVLQLGSADGKQKLADELTSTIQDVLSIEMGDPGIESVLYRSFILQ